MAASTEAAPEMAKLKIQKGVDDALLVGGLRIKACRREVDVIDGGITVYVFSQPDGTPEDASVELVRIDLFRNRPHYHAPAENDAETAIEGGGENAVAWALDALTTRMPELAVQAGKAELVAGFDTAALAKAGPEIQGLFDRLAEPTETSFFEVPASVIASLRAPESA